MSDKDLTRSIKQCPRCLGEKKEPDGSKCKLCEGKCGLDSISVGDTEIIVKDKAHFVG